MSTVERQIWLARRRLTANVFFERLCQSLLVAAAAWAVLILLARTFGLEFPVWHGAWVALAGAVVAAGALTWIARPTPLGAAVRLDAASGLKERLSTALVVARSRDPFAQAAVQDANRLAGRLHVPALIRYETPRLVPWSAATMMAAVLLAAFMPRLDLFADERSESAVDRKAVEAERARLESEWQKQLEKVRALAEQRPELKESLPDPEPLVAPNAPPPRPEDLRREAVKRIDDVGEKLRRELERSELSGLSELKRMLARLDPQGSSRQSDKLSDALSRSDFSGAARALQEMRKQLDELARAADNPEAQRKLQEMEQQLRQLAEQLAKMSETLSVQKDLENKAGLTPEEAKKLLEELAKMDPKQLREELQKRLSDKGLSEQQIKQIAQKIQQQQQAQKACQNLAQALRKASDGCKACNNPGSGGQGQSQAQAGLSDAASQLSELEMAESMLSELRAQLSDLEQLRDSVCQGDKPGGNLDGDRKGIGSQGSQYGLGRGERIGKETVAHRLDPTKARTRYESGVVTGQMLIDGPQVAGEASAEVLAAAEAGVREASEAIERNAVPRQYDRVLREYFERLAGLVQESGRSGVESP